MIDKNKQYRTRDGREVRIYATDGAGSHPIQGAVLHEGGWVQRDWDALGYYSLRANQSSFADLVEVKPRIRRTMWVNIYDSEHDTLYFVSRDLADRYPRNPGERLACIKMEIDCEHGHGLEPFGEELT